VTGVHVTAEEKANNSKELCNQLQELLNYIVRSILILIMEYLVTIPLTN